MLVTFCQEHMEKCSYKLILPQIREGSQGVAEDSKQFLFRDGNY